MSQWNRGHHLPVSEIRAFLVNTSAADLSSGGDSTFTRERVTEGKRGWLFVVDGLALDGGGEKGSPHKSVC